MSSRSPPTSHHSLQPLPSVRAHRPCLCNEIGNGKKSTEGTQAHIGQKRAQPQKSKEPYPKNQSEKIANILKFLACKMQ